jgi:CheY-like chemotaxis protein
MIRLLIADDQVPDTTLSSDQKIRERYSALYHDDPNRDDIVEWTLFLRKLVHLLQAQAYQVDCANTPRAVLDLTKRNTYDAIILDLGWYALKEKPYGERMVYGYQLGNQIRQNLPAAPILMFSNRYYDDDNLARTAAENGFLPVYKSRDEVCMKHLLVTIRWLLDKTTFDDRMREKRKAHEFRMYQLLSFALLGSIALSWILMGITVRYVLRNDLEVTAAATIFGLVSSFISHSIYRYVNQYRKSLGLQ